MDENLEWPSTLTAKTVTVNPEDDDQSSGDEDGGLDWTKLIPAAARPVIPKRGEKEFEPRANGGTNLQLHILDRARQAMFETLRTTRTISNKGISYGIWYPTLARTHVTVPRGIHFTSMGHSAPRPTLDENGATKIQKRPELLPEEAIYLIERGALFCWKECDVDVSTLQGFEGIAGAPMSVQQAYAEMLGKENITLEKFQVYAYLRRLGYAVTRTEAPNNSYPMPPPFNISKSISKPPILRRILSPFSCLLRRAFHILSPGFSWWKPLRLSRWVHHDYASIYHYLRFLPSSHSIPLHQPPSLTPPSSSPYKIFYNVYKPSTPFKKTAPPLPDFQVVVINARTTPMPTLHELSTLFDLLPELPPPLPRPRRQAYGGGKSTVAPATTPMVVETHRPSTSTPGTVQTPAVPSQPQNPSVAAAQPVKWTTNLRRILPFLFSSPPPQSQQPQSERRPNPFAALKQGKKTIVIAAVDNGNTSFFRFSQGAFEEWPMA